MRQTKLLQNSFYVESEKFNNMDDIINYFLNNYKTLSLIFLVLLQLLSLSYFIIIITFNFIVPATRSLLSNTLVKYCYIQK